jgi:hypothetical protein
MRQNEQQVADLTQRLAAMQREKEQLESRARLLEQVVSLNLTHEARLHTNKVRKTGLMAAVSADLAHAVGYSHDCYLPCTCCWW